MALPIADVIRAEATRSSSDPNGRPLPLAAHWHRMTTPLEFQLRLIEQGHHLLPWIPTPEPDWTTDRVDKVFAQTGTSVVKLAAMKLPFAFVTGGQWEADLYDHLKQWRMLPVDKSPLVVPLEPLFSTNGLPKPTAKMLSPFGAVEPWKEVGRYWIDTPGLRRYQDAYPDPPLVLFISNNEAGRLKKAEEDKRYLDKYGAGRDAAFQQKVMGDGWMERYGAMIKAMRAGLDKEAWRKNSRFIAYNAFGPGLLGKLPADAERVSWTWQAWDGGLPSYYDNHWQMPAKAICNVWSCQTECMNWVFMKELALKVNPEYWLELIYWDGDFSTFDAGGNVLKYSMRGRFYNDLGFPPTPERYRGWIQYGLWLTLPRVAREWRGSADPNSQWWARFAEIIRAVDLVYADPVLTKFWRKSELAPNRAVQHPWTEHVPAKFKDVSRWYHLSTDLDPTPPWKDDTRMPVYALARVIGHRPLREWLVYAHGTLENQKQVRITIPDHKAISVPVSVGGSFYHVKEADGSATPVGDARAIKLAPIDPEMAKVPAREKEKKPKQNK
jgi:hypothetical protein